MTRLNRQERADVRWWAAYWIRWAVVAVVLVAAGALLLHRYVGRAELDIDARNRRASFERQDTDRKTLARKLTEWTALDPGDTAHQAAMRDEMCALVDEIRGSMTPTQTNWANQNC